MYGPFFPVPDRHDNNHDSMENRCNDILRAGPWKYQIDAETYKEMHVDGDSKATMLHDAVVNVNHQRTADPITTGIVNGVCTAAHSMEPDSCHFTFSFGAAGTLSVRGPLDKVGNDCCCCMDSMLLVVGFQRMHGLIAANLISLSLTCFLLHLYR